MVSGCCGRSVFLVESPQLLPDPFGLGSYGRAFDVVDLARYTLNSLVVATLAAVLSVPWRRSPASRWRAPPLRRRLLVVASVVALMVPVTALLNLRFTLFSWVGVTDTWILLLAPALLGTSPPYSHGQGVPAHPTSCTTSAGLHDLTPFQTWLRVAMPLVRPVTVVVGVCLPRLVGQRPRPARLPRSRTSSPCRSACARWPRLRPGRTPPAPAGAAVATAPVVVLFLVAQRWFLHEFRGAHWLAR